LIKLGNTDNIFNVYPATSFVRLSHIIAVLTGTGGRASKRSLIVRFTVFGRVPCSGARRRGKELDVVSTAIPGGEAARNK